MATPHIWRYALSCWMLAALALAAGVGAQSYWSTGPCPVRRHSYVIQLPEASGCGAECALSLTLAVPDGDGPNRSACRPPPHPLVLFLSGFQLRASFYTPYAHRLASWGFAVLQYDTALLHITGDRTEVGYLSHLLAALRREAGRPGSPLAGQLDLSALAAAGHSRGGKLAALHLAAGNVQAAFLIDPVDSGAHSPESAEDPSAVEALRGLGRTAGIAAAGVAGPCNPSGSNSSHFFGVLGVGSWLETVLHAGHMQFTNIPSALAREAFDLLCHAGSDSHEAAMQLAAAPMAAWLDRWSASSTSVARRRRLLKRVGSPLLLPHAGAAAMAGLRPFRDWVRNQTAAGEISFAVKAAPPPQQVRAYTGTGAPLQEA